MFLLRLKTDRDPACPFSGKAILESAGRLFIEDDAYWDGLGRRDLPVLKFGDEVLSLTGEARVPKTDSARSFRQVPA